MPLNVSLEPVANPEESDVRSSVPTGYSSVRFIVGQQPQHRTEQEVPEDFPYLHHQKHGVLRAAVVNFDAALLPNNRPTSDLIDKVVKRHLPTAMRERAKQAGQTALALLLATQSAVVDEALQLVSEETGKAYNYYQYQIGAPEGGLTLYAAFVIKPPHHPTPRRGLVSNKAADEAFRRLYEVGAA